ncbi:uncharacterized protein E0L32_000296 [Thyridium curvatum]|uniref:Zn(2)-C6 fungal-type domain-containing protein n=1 Tax=Thyridium curvatum TaxID=1093900 RepID=A0A507B120_9PEZI|nr:uncharacterized protein E0L32_000296 [Thyridium curvatum]TPX15962.1 hypothetical protein E0L32_000296 [Thyridium curvatum]
MSASLEAPVLRRKRVVKACDTCRGMKSKCDGKHPCGRCEGFGYQCAYSKTDRRKHKSHLRGHEPLPGLDAPPQHHTTQQILMVKDTICELEDAIAGYGKLIQDTVPNLAEPGRSELLSKLAPVQDRVEQALARVTRVHSAETVSPGRPVWPISIPPSRGSSNSQRYLGEVSDVRFFNLVKTVLQKNLPERVDDGIDSYEQDDPVSDGPTPNDMELPSPELADLYLEIYFSTIHIAYPFIPRRAFTESWVKFRDSGASEDIDNYCLVLTKGADMLFAIGAYYRSFPDNQSKGDHERYFFSALTLSNRECTERSANFVIFLLTQCFYLLAVCRTDRCWNTLGHAVRVAQSIGLHVEMDPSKVHRGKALGKAEMRRRLWYSLYVLDRLLSLQLGRPPAIHDDDCHLSLPAERHEEEEDDENGHTHVQLLAADALSTGSYFLAVIALSRIIGYVLRGLYSPHQRGRAEEGLHNTKAMDAQLLDWKRNLPRTLRFDFGHAFETSAVFKRQRNMLAIKFHHLRALIHRPYLCLPSLRHPDEPTSAAPPPGNLESFTIAQYEKTCIFEAQKTAQLLHKVSDKKELVHDFPWWQMISCLICASSILVVAGMFAQRGEDDVDVAALNNDAETCMRVFEALSAQSEGARIARDMMSRLRERGEKWSSMERDSQGQVPNDNVSMGAPEEIHMPVPVGPGTDQAPFLEQCAPSPGAFGNFLPDAQEWPSEIFDSMAWSAQFFGTAAAESLDLM